MRSCALQIVLVEPKLMLVNDVGSDMLERLEFPRDRVVDFALGWGHLVVATATQCFIYSVTNWNTPHIFDLRATVQLIVQCENYFLVMDPTGVTIFSYEGRVVSTPRFSGLKPEFLDKASRNEPCKSLEFLVQTGLTAYLSAIEYSVTVQ